MYFKKLEMFGFKSFADKTTLKFEPGVTAVVGPNGCGKSNVFDAIRWVLGEQSAKSLRGGSMEDVIFGGTSAKAALGFAEVTVTFDNQSKTLPVEYDEVAVTRRLFRSGKSEYLINKAQVRLKDIQEMFMGTGIGAEAYSFVAQGRVDKVVSAKPEDRRQIFDEAAGITKYKSKKKDALNKLKDTDNNLLRINDIVTEVKRQIGSLERQAKKAQRYQDEFQKLQQLETTHAVYQMNELDKQREAVKHMLDNIDDKEEDLTLQINELKSLVERENLALEDIEDHINETRAKDIRLENDIELNTRQIAFNEERLESLSTSETRLEQQKKQLAEKCQIQRSKIEELREALSTVSDESQQIKSRLDEQRSLLEEVVTAMSAEQEAIKEDEEQILVLGSRQRQIKNGLTEVMKEVQSYLAKKRRLDIEKEKVTEEQDIVTKKIMLFDEQLTNLRQERHELGEVNQKERERLNQLEAQFNQQSHDVDVLENKKRFLISQMEFVEKLQVQYEENPEGSRQGRFYSRDQAPAQTQGGFVGKIQQVNHLEDGQCEVFCEMKFLELNPGDVESKISGVDRDIVNLRAQRDKTSQEIQTQSEEIEQSQIKLHDKEKAISICESQKVDCREEAEKIVRELEAIDIEYKDADDQLASLDSREKELGQQLQEIDEDLHERQQRIKSSQDRIVSRQHERESVSVTIAQLETECNALLSREKTQRENLELFSKTLESDLSEIERLNSENIEQGGKKEGIREEIQACRERIKEIDQEKISISDLLQEYVQQKEDLAQRVESMNTSIDAMQKEVSSFKDIVHKQEFKNQEIDYKVEALRERLMQAYKINLNDIVHDVEAHLETAAVPEEYKTQENNNLNIDELIAEIARLKKRCDSFGSVNMDAMQEYEDLKERFEFLTKQQSDLLESKDALQKAINKINRTTRQLFTETFVKVNEEFRVYYRMLFGGGEAELILQDPDDALESGIDIVARPPGKKLQNINLLSGGEKTMTAIALIFAVFKVNPSPFCVLDEIDAALDEANVERFATVLREFAKIAQFIIITHNKKTIDHANTMYGVTMQETGISSVVSVKLTDNEKKVAAAASALAAA